MTTQSEIHQESAEIINSACDKLDRASIDLECVPNDCLHVKMRACIKAIGDLSSTLKEVASVQEMLAEATFEDR